MIISSALVSGRAVRRTKGGIRGARRGRSVVGGRHVVGSHPPVVGVPALNPRMRRLEADYQRLIVAFSGHPHLRLEPVGPVPPERYRIVYNVPGIRVGPENKLVKADQHVVHLQLPAGYPREQPYCTTEEQIFHPNFGNHICIADYWSPSQSLVDVVVQIGEMLQYRLYNTRSPLNAVAARWASEHLNVLPIGRLELLPRVPEIKLGAEREVAEP
jgi:ubiquitin-protein ligase